MKNKARVILSVILLFFIVGFFFLGCSEDNTTASDSKKTTNSADKKTKLEAKKIRSIQMNDDGENKVGESNFDDMSAEELKQYHVTITTKFGEIELEFYPDVAPNHVKNFLKLADSEFYDGTTFHRVIPGFMIQGGDPNTKDDDPANDGMGGPGYSIDAEFSDVPHERGILSMARSRDPNSAGSQFFIMHQKSPHLDGQYSVFGKVVEGLEVVDDIVSVETDQRDRPLEDVEMTMKVFTVE